jgi:hypothetical protein
VALVFAVTLAIAIALDSWYTVTGLQKGIAQEGNELLSFVQLKLGVLHGTILYSSIEWCALALPSLFLPYPIRGFFMGGCAAMSIKHAYGAWQWSRLF